MKNNIIDQLFSLFLSITKRTRKKNVLMKRMKQSVCAMQMFNWNQMNVRVQLQRLIGISKTDLLQLYCESQIHIIVYISHIQKYKNCINSEFGCECMKYAPLYMSFFCDLPLFCLLLFLLLFVFDDRTRLTNKIIHAFF